MTTTHRIASASAAVGGLAWLLDTTIISFNNGSFGIPDNILYLGGLFTIAFAVLAAGFLLTAGRPLVLRAVLAAVGFALFMGAATGVDAGVRALVHAAYSGHNRGLNEETGLMAIALIVLATAVVAARSASRSRSDHDAAMASAA